MAANTRLPSQALLDNSSGHSLPPRTPSPRRPVQMADVMQPLPPPPPSAAMLHSRTSSDNFTSSQQSQAAQRTPQQARSAHTPVSPQYRATSAAPIQPYAFQATPGLRQASRPASTTHTQKPGSRSGSGMVTPVSGSREDLPHSSRPHSIISLTTSVPDLTLNSYDTTSRASPERYRRSSSNRASPAMSAATPSGNGMAAVEHLYMPPPAHPIVQRTSSEDSQQSVKSTETAKRYRRRSTANLEAGASQPGVRPTSSNASLNDSKSAVGMRPGSAHSRQTSRDSTRTPLAISTPTFSEINTGKPLPPSPGRIAPKESSPVRGGDRRGTSPSPLSGPAISHDPSPAKSRSPTRSRSPQKSSPHKMSPAAQHLAALSDKDLNKGMKSRLRRAFSFGSAAELRKASVTRSPVENLSSGAAGASQTDDMDAEQREIVRRQEAAGFGAGIYHGQGGFSGSSDNLSISSTASSASVMLRKMGSGMKKGGRSLKGLFRPKSVIGIPAADAPLQPSLAEVSMVTVEAERQRVNINVNAADQAHGGTGFPKLEQNSIDGAAALPEGHTSGERNDSLRKSIVGSEKERAEVLAAVKKGILKRSTTSSPQGSPMIRPQTATFREDNSVTTGSPTASMPGTPKDERKSRSLSSTNSSNDYFSPRLNLATRSMPATPQSNRNISFSPRIQFHDVWSSTEYDRRGEIATCNRLTPILAQQIKEELNSFKMEMEVHELSKPHTHFF